MSESPNQPSNQPQPKDEAVQEIEKKEPTTGGQRVLIGSQRDAAAAHEDKKRDWYVPGQDQDKDAAEKDSGQKAGEKDSGVEIPAAEPVAVETATPVTATEEPAAVEPPAVEPIAPAASLEVDSDSSDLENSDLEDVDIDQTVPSVAAPGRHFPPPNIRGNLSPELEAELSLALGDASIDDLMAGSESITNQPILEPESRHTGRVVAVQRDDVFVELGAREQGVVPLKLFEEPPEAGAELTVIVTRFNQTDGVYDLLVPNASANVSDWSDLTEGMLVTAIVTGHNTGGLECEVNKIRGFIPVSHISLYRVENVEEFVGEKFICLVTEADPERRNLVLSRRAVLEKEQEEARKKLLASLEVGQVHDGVVRKIMDFGAFVDIGGVDGLVHISQLAWGRVEHPSEVLTEGQTIQVKILKMDEAGNRIGLGYRDMIESPWTDIESKYPVNSLIKGKVTKLMEFGAFVELEPGVEGLVHISELSHKRLWRTSDAVSEGQEVEIMVKSVDAKAQRIGLSMKDALPQLETAGKKDAEAELAEPAVQKALNKPSKPLKGGLGSGAGGDQFGLNW